MEAELKRRAVSSVDMAGPPRPLPVAIGTTAHSGRVPFALALPVPAGAPPAVAAAAAAVGPSSAVFHPVGGAVGGVGMKRAHSSMAGSMRDLEDLARPSSDPLLRTVPGIVRRSARALMLRVLDIQTSPCGTIKLVSDQPAPGPGALLPKVLELRGSWAYSPVAVGMRINVIADPCVQHQPVPAAAAPQPHCAASVTSAQTLPLSIPSHQPPASRRYVPPSPVGPHWIVDDERGLVVLQPEVLVAGTRVADSVHCVRRSVLEEKIRGETGAAGLAGQMTHALFERALTLGTFDAERLRAEADEIVAARVEDLFQLDSTESEALQQLRETVPLMSDWARRFLHQGVPAAERGVLSDGGRGPHMSAVRISRVLGVEEAIWSPALGIKGVVDVPVDMAVQSMCASPGVDELLLRGPLELKTGRPPGSMYTVSHRAQLVLYMLLMAERYELDVEAGLLCYLRSGKMFSICATWPEVRSLVMARNALAVALAPLAALPEMLGRERDCLRCHQIDTCMLLHRSLDRGTDSSSGIASVFTERTGHLLSAHEEYVRRWWRLIELEYETALRQRQELWTLPPAARERTGRCFAHMERICTGASQRGFESAFRRHGGGLSLLDSAISIGDGVLCMPQGGPLTMAVGVVRDLSPESVLIEFSAELREPQGAPRPLLWSIDKSEILSGFSICRENLTRLMFRTERETRLRELIVDLAPPRFDSAPVGDLQSDPSFAGLNEDQRSAVEAVLSAQDYALILGMPGTGKTTTIARIVALLAARGRSVLLTSYTHTALDNILLKLASMGVDFLRLGRANQVHPDLVSYTLRARSRALTVSDMHDLLRDKNIIASTCLSTNHPLITRRRFDACVVDEAGQLTEPVVLGPLRRAQTFVLVGDHHQLQPVVRSRVAREEGMMVSLLERLCAAHPAAVRTLARQYRMCDAVMRLANELVYKGALRCGDPAVAEARLALPQLDRLVACAPDPWLLPVIDAARPVVFANTDAVPAPETRTGEGVRNHHEALMVETIVRGLLNAGLPADEIGVISPYRAQLQLLQHALQDTRVDTCTVDRYQGRDKDCIIVSLVRCNDDGQVGELLVDWRRINVAFTRARRKLIVLGSGRTLAGAPICRAFLEFVRAQQWELQLPVNAVTATGDLFAE